MAHFEDSMQENIDFEFENIRPSTVLTLGYERGGTNKPRTKPKVDDEEEEVHVKRRDPYGTKNAQKIYNVNAEIKKNKMQGRNTVEEVLCLSAQRNYTVFYRNCEDSKVLSDIVVAHPTSIEMMRMWSYVLIMDTTYKTNKYNMPILEVVGMTPTGKNFTVATAVIQNEQGMWKLLVSSYHLSTKANNKDEFGYWKMQDLKYDKPVSPSNSKIARSLGVQPVVAEKIHNGHRIWTCADRVMEEEDGS
ncbi:hypothetical protein M9H77_12090 [Catharanthus roseus]|uniref:Uncharacterized protein n=1 Tax=Catharanthus roseus TaxID=4058 RepID=A0ACC0BGI3_CATRO|nr:hypothetical protein M9H77_12090 [Catharanthus roseus]